MELEKQLVSLELAKKLKELGVPQESYFNHCEACNSVVTKHEDSPCEQMSDSDPAPHMLISLYTVAELGELLPQRLPNKEKTKYLELRYQLGQTESHWIEIVVDVDGDGAFYDEYESIRADTEANARAKALIYLLEHGYLDTKTL